MTLRELLQYRNAVQSTPRKTEKIQILAQLIRHLEENEIEIALALFTGTFPFGKLGIGPATLRQVLQTSSGRPTVSPSLRQLSMLFQELAALQGPESPQERIRMLRQIFQALTPEEARWLAEAILGEVHQGAGERSLLEAIGKAYGIPASDLKQAYLFGMSLAEIIRQARRGDLQPSPKLFIPVRPMLAYPAEGVEEALASLKTSVQWEYKLDGARFQVHKEGDEIRVFSRHLREITSSVPELVELVRTLEPETLILEGELVALDAHGHPLPFQHFMRRFGKKKDIEEARRQRPLTPFFFDALFVESGMTSLPLEKRIRILKEVVPPPFLTPSIQTSDPTAVREFFEQAVDWGAEGLMAKKLDSPYVAGERVGLWLKVKPYEVLDCLIIAAEWGHGRRKGWLSNYLLAVWDETRTVPVPVGKTFKGLTDKQFRWMTQRLLTLKEDEFPGGIWVRPELVVEVAFSEVQESPKYPSGFALRFARIKRIRVDKNPSEANTLEDLRRIYAMQHQKRG